MSCTSCGKSKLQKLQDIAEGIKNFVFNDAEIEALALPRLQVCGGCLYIRELAKVNGVPVLQCTVCTCLTALKTRVKEEVCPKGKW